MPTIRLFGYVGTFMVFAWCDNIPNPQLALVFCVVFCLVGDRMANGEAGSGPFWGKPEWRGEEGYYKMLVSSFASLLAAGEPTSAMPAAIKQKFSGMF